MRTIIAPATPLGGPISIIRMSGEKAPDILQKLCGKIPNPRMVTLVIIDTGTIKDKCLVVFYDKDKSYTGEKSVEIFCHGSKIIVSEIIKFAIENGATLAERGEFTRRAYENKKMDLNEAESLLSLINSETVEQANNAFSGAEGALSRKIEFLQARLKSLIASLEVAIDYPEEDIETITISRVKSETDSLLSEVKTLLDSYNDSRKLFGGIRIVLTGKTNVGKSSLFNALLGFKRAIVSNVAGTTRDVIESDYIYKGRKFILADTAGLRSAKGKIESEGINLALEQVKTADLIVGVGVKDDEFLGKADLVVTNKCDINKGVNLNVSAKTGEGIDDLKAEIYRLTDFEPRGIKVNLRQFEALKIAEAALIRAKDSKLTADCISADLTEAYNGLGKITGVIGSDEIIDEIFSAFCVGK